MSCYGTRTTPLFEIKIDHVVTYDDSQRGVPFFGPKLEIFARLWTREFNLTLRKKRKGNRNWYRWSGTVGTPLGEIGYSTDTYPAQQYSGDYTENMDARRKETT